MLIKDLIDEKYTLHTKSELNIEISGMYSGDLLSNAISKAVSGGAFITVISNTNTVAVAVMVDIPLIILCEGLIPTDEMIKRAEDEDITILSTIMKSYECVIDLYNKGL